MLTATIDIRWTGARYTVVVILVYPKCIQDELEPREKELL